MGAIGTDPFPSPPPGRSPLLSIKQSSARRVSCLLCTPTCTQGQPPSPIMECCALALASPYKPVKASPEVCVPLGLPCLMLH